MVHGGDGRWGEVVWTYSEWRVTGLLTHHESRTDYDRKTGADGPMVLWPGQPLPFPETGKSVKRKA